MSKEDRAVGAVELKTWVRYVTGSGYFMMFLFVFIFLVSGTNNQSHLRPPALPSEANQGVFSHIHPLPWYLACGTTVWKPIANVSARCWKSWTRLVHFLLDRTNLQQHQCRHQHYLRIPRCHW